MTVRLQDLTTYLKQITDEDLFEASHRCLFSCSNGYLSKSISYTSLLSACIQSLSSSIHDVAYEHQALPLGFIVYSSSAFPLSCLSSSDLLPLNGIRVTQIASESDSTDISQTTLQSVTRDDLSTLFSALDLMVNVSDIGMQVKEGYVMKLFSTEDEYAEINQDPQYDGYFVYNPSIPSVRLPNLQSLYVKSTSYQEHLTTKQVAQLPNVYGTFANGITEHEIVDSKSISSMYAGSIYIAADNAIDYYESLNSVSNAIYKKSLSKKLRDADVFMFDPTASGQSTVYSRSDDRVFFDSVLLCPCMVVKPCSSIVKGL